MEMQTIDYCLFSNIIHFPASPIHFTHFTHISYISYLSGFCFAYCSDDFDWIHIMGKREDAVKRRTRLGGPFRSSDLGASEAQWRGGQITLSGRLSIDFYFIDQVPITGLIKGDMPPWSRHLSCPDGTHSILHLPSISHRRELADTTIFPDPRGCRKAFVMQSFSSHPWLPDDPT